MPGLVGLITRMPRERASAELRQMLEAIRHEPFYETGTWIDASVGVYVGWAMRKQLLADAMPIRNGRGDVVLVFSGEEYSDRGTTGPGRDHLVRRYEDDRSFPAGLNGRFQGLVVDGRRGAAMLFTDRYGMQRVYYHASHEAFYFAAEAKAILAGSSRAPSPGREDVGRARRLRLRPGESDALRRRSRPSGRAAWMFRHGVLEEQASYFEPREWEEQEILARGLLPRAARGVLGHPSPLLRRPGADRHVADRRTGHTDDHGVAAATPAPLRCYTFGGMFVMSGRSRGAASRPRSAGIPTR